MPDAAEPAAEPTGGAADTSEPAPSTASFAVASTGVIDIVTADAESEQHPDADQEGSRA